MVGCDDTWRGEAWRDAAQWGVTRRWRGVAWRGAMMCDEAGRGEAVAMVELNNAQQGSARTCSADAFMNARGAAWISPLLKRRGGERG